MFLLVIGSDIVERHCPKHIDHRDDCRVNHNDCGDHDVHCADYHCADY